jgi:formate--tetrahydrofolate ligase
VVEIADRPARRDGDGFRVLYPDDMPLWEKVRTVATRIYGASDIIADRRIRDRFRELQTDGFGDLPVCIAKTQYSFSTDPDLRGAPNDHVVPIREVRLAAGAGFIVVICGEIMTMPGLPKSPAAERLRIDESGQTEGLF